jgi:hypothetical protein
MSAGGNSRGESLEELRKLFEQRKASMQQLPRPGTKVPIQWAAQERVNQHKELVQDFINRIFGVEWAWISDDSSLGDFRENESNDVFVQKIRDTYGVDVSDMTTGNLADILDRIGQNRRLNTQ